MENLVNPWKGRRVLVTGHTGFKGGWLSLWLASLGAHVRGYSLAPPTEPNLFAAARVGEHVEDIRGDIRDYDRLQSAVAEFQPEVVFHLAAQPLVRRSYADPLGTYATNVMGTAHVLECARGVTGIRAIVIITTDKCYLNREWVWPYRETDSLGGFDPYASSKACAEIVSASYRDSYFAATPSGEHRVGIATGRAGNVIGGGDWSEDRLIPDLIRGFLSGKPALIRRPTAIRPWQHVLEPLKGYLMLAEQLLAGREEFATSFNFGPPVEDACPVEQIADRLVRIWGDGVGWTRDKEPGVHEAHYLRLDASKARSGLNWTPRLTTDRALEWTVQWFRAWSRGADMHRETVSQISSYESISQSAQPVLQDR